MALEPSVGTGSRVLAAIAEADALHARVRRMAASFDPRPETFESLARAIAQHQVRHLQGYARLCEARGVSLDSIERVPLDRLPAVPTDAFRLARIATYPPEHDIAVFRTSGTTGSTGANAASSGAIAARGAHPMRTLDTYHDVSLAFARRTLFSSFGEGTEGGELGETKPRIVAIALTPSELEDSSLSRMLGWFVDELGAPGSSFVRPDELPRVVEVLGEASRGAAKVLVLATAFAYVHLLDHLYHRQNKTISLPAGSRAMQTGGFKGRTREVSASELRTSIAHAFGIAPRDVVGEYGMTELSSQLYAISDGSDDDPSRFVYRAPPWVRVMACDPSTLAPLPRGARGIARIEDLANVESAWAIQTMDEVMVDDDGGVELLGRAPTAAARGCSIAVDELIGGAS